MAGTPNATQDSQSPQLSENSAVSNPTRLSTPSSTGMAQVWETIRDM